ncbi:Hypothetical protein ORPV_636 [Orpheovirus IHUMI-LCC2]|uniref:F-box domain-containing protein n=1 Tax=Orpheovirus IHUMI-LCC2 TaxID=2023057 RepID=A0A2I2L4W1_9VIRU|nr:Hypothetical protein ORPV_636 [Orpheovirus IHUMI-LCC2]SNW62540.1 Hypothetical protein ORPV_636 [Orpheovirus IHUMI-LCC2]
MDNTISDIPNEILAIILGNGSYEDLIKYCYSSNKTLQSCNTNYVRNTIIDKFLPPGLDYSRYTIEELLQLGKFNAMHCVDLYLYVNTSDVNDENNRLASTLLGSEAYKKAIINIYVLPFMKDDNYKTINDNNGSMDWLLGVKIDELIKLCGILYPIDSLLDIINVYDNQEVSYKLFDLFSRMFQTNRSKEDIVSIFEKYVKTMIGKYDQYFYNRLSNISILFSGNLDNFIHFCIKFNREDIINYKILQITKEYVAKYNMRNDLMRIYDKFTSYNYIEMSDIVKEFMKYGPGGVYSQLYSGYIVHGGTITKEIKNIFSNPDYAGDWFKYTDFTSQLYEIVKDYLPNKAFDYSYIANLINMGVDNSSLDYIRLVTYVLGESYDNVTFTNALPNGHSVPDYLYFILESNNMIAIKSIFNKYYPDVFVFNSPYINEFRKLLFLKEEIYKERDVTGNIRSNDYLQYINTLKFYNKLYCRLLYEDIERINSLLYNL